MRGAESGIETDEAAFGNPAKGREHFLQPMNEPDALTGGNYCENASPYITTVNRRRAGVGMRLICAKPGRRSRPGEPATRRTLVAAIRKGRAAAC